MPESLISVYTSRVVKTCFSLLLAGAICIVNFSCHSSKATAGAERVNSSTVSSKLPMVVTAPDYNKGATVIFSSGEVIAEGGNPVIRRGLCWSVNPLPTIADDTTINGSGTGRFKSTLEHLTPNTLYYVRGYATNKKGTAYGEVVQMSTIPRGNITYKLVKADYSTPEEEAAYQRITSAMDSALYFYNNYTSIQKNLTVYYNKGVPTADGNFNGTIRFGANPKYSQTGTAMHEIAHVMGVGQHSVWFRTLISGGIYQGTNAQKVLRSLTGDSTLVLKGDRQHFWPFGINGYWEDTGDKQLYITHALIVAGMKKDGLPSN